MRIHPLGLPLYIQNLEDCTVVEFQVPSLTDAAELEAIGRSLYDLVDKEDRRRIVLDMDRVQFVSSQFVGVVMVLHKKLSTRPNGLLVLCNLGASLRELLKITRLDRVLTVTKTPAEAIKKCRA